MISEYEYHCKQIGEIQVMNNLLFALKWLFFPERRPSTVAIKCEKELSDNWKKMKEIKDQM